MHDIEYYMQWMPLTVSFNMASKMMTANSLVDSAYYNFGNEGVFE